MKLKILYLLIAFFVAGLPINAEDFKVDTNNTKFNVYSGMFDFSDDGKRSTLIGFQHQNVDLNKDTFLGNLSPITGALITSDNAAYFYTGVQAQYSIGALNVIPSFTPGIYEQGDGKDLGHIIEFKSEVQLSLDLPKDSPVSYTHLTLPTNREV